MKFLLGRISNNTVILSEAQRSRRTCFCLSFSVKGTGSGPYIHPLKSRALAAEGFFIRIYSRLILFSVALAALPLFAQTAPATPPAPPQQTQPHQGQVIFSRTTDENGQTTTQSGPAAVPRAAEGELASPQVAAADAERQAVTFTAFDLDVHLRPAEQHLAVRAQLTVRNDGKTPLTRILLQLSSSLNWERIRIESKDAVFQIATLNSDADHTGQLHEAIVPLAQPLAPGESLRVDATYSGVIAPSAQRLLAIGAPSEVAQHTEWDQISLPFTGLRGFGNVVWYPAASVPVLLGDGARLFNEMGEHKLRLTGAHFRLRLIVEFPHGQAPTVALINGRAVPLTITESNSLDQSQEVASVAAADSGDSTLGFEAPSLFVAIRTPHPAANLTAWTLPEDDLSQQFWTTAATAVTPFLQGWLGQQPRSQLTLLDLPDPEDAPYETGSLLAVPLREAAPLTNIKTNPGSLNGILVHALTHAWLQPPTAQQPPPAWLNEGVATFMGTLWVEKQRGLEAALGALEADRAALALAEPESPGQSAGQPLAQAISPVYYRTKAAYLLWMLRDLAGDPALSAALRADSFVAPSPDTNKNSGNPSTRGAFEKQLEATAGCPDLAWFFADWVDADKGLPDLSIDGVFPTSASSGNWLVAVHLGNAGYADAEVPVTVRSATASVTQRVRIPARGKTVQRFLVQGKPTEVQANDGTVPEAQASVHITRLDAPDGSSSSSSLPTPPR
jgi:hypothetical protein